MIRTLPFRITDPVNELNMFALEDAYINQHTTDNSFGDVGVFVKITSGNLDATSVVYGTNSYLGKTSYPNVYNQFYPSNPLRVAPAYSGDGLNAIGMTMEGTAKFDENDEKLLHNTVKKTESSVVSPGESVKILTRGIIEVSTFVFDGVLGIGSGIKLSATSGKITGCPLSDAGRFGKVLMTGNRSVAGDRFSGQTAVIQFAL